MRAHLLSLSLLTLATPAFAQTPLEVAALSTVAQVINLSNMAGQSPQQGQLKNLLAETVLVDNAPMPRWSLIQAFAENAGPDMIVSFQQMRAVATCQEATGTCRIDGNVEVRRSAQPNQPEDIAYVPQVYGVTCRHLAPDDCIVIQVD